MDPFFLVKGLTILLTFASLSPFQVDSTEWGGRLMMEDHFYGNRLRGDLWEYDDNCNGKGPGTKTLECFQLGDNISVNNGTLTIKARTDVYDKRKDTMITSAKIRTSGSGFSYGTFVIRARLPRGKHLLPSIWIQPVKQDEDFCRYEEIDVVECRGQRPSTLIFSAHYGRIYTQSVGRRYEKVFPKMDFSKDFHEYALRWRPTRLQWFLDGKKMYEVTTHFMTDWTDDDETHKPCNHRGPHRLFSQESHLVMGLLVGGVAFSHPKYGNLTMREALRWPKPTLEVDYVRIYQD